MEKTFPLPVLRLVPGWVGMSCAQQCLCPQRESSSHSTGTGREEEVCQPPAGSHFPLHQLLQEVAAMGHLPFLGRATQPGLQGVKDAGMYWTAAVIEVRFRGRGWIWHGPQTCPCSPRFPALGWGRAFPPWSHQLSVAALQNNGLHRLLFPVLVMGWWGDPSNTHCEAGFLQPGPSAQLGAPAEGEKIVPRTRYPNKSCCAKRQHFFMPGRLVSHHRSHPHSSPVVLRARAIPVLWAATLTHLLSYREVPCASSILGGGCGAH